MELSNITICRQDVVVVSDSEIQGSENGSKKRKKTKPKTECVRKVQLTRMTVDRIVPLCYRQRCRRAQFYHRTTCKNTIHRRNQTPRNKETQSKSRTEKSESVPRVLWSPITVESSSDQYENVSSRTFSPVSSDSDELEQLIKTTRERMKEEKVVSNTKISSLCLNETPGYENITTTDDECNNISIHSLETVIGEDKLPMPNILQEVYKETPDIGNDKDKKLLSCCNINNNEIIQQKSPSPIISSKKSSGELSPVYEISCKAGTLCRRQDPQAVV